MLWCGSVRLPCKSRDAHGAARAAPGRAVPRAARGRGCAAAPPPQRTPPAARLARVRGHAPAHRRAGRRVRRQWRARAGGRGAAGPCSRVRGRARSRARGRAAAARAQQLAGAAAGRAAAAADRRRDGRAGGRGRRGAGTGAPRRIRPDLGAFTPCLPWRQAPGVQVVLRIRLLQNRPGGRSTAAGAWGAQGEHDGFERFAAALQAPRTLQAAQALLRRLQQRLPAPPRPARPVSAGATRGARAGAGAGSDVARLLARLFPRAPAAAAERYPARVFLSAYMLLAHPEARARGGGASRADPLLAVRGPHAGCRQRTPAAPVGNGLLYGVSADKLI